MTELPHNFEAEQALLGAMLFDNAAFHRVSDITAPDHFADPLHRTLFGNIASLIERGQVASAVTINPLVSLDADLRKAGGNAYLVKLLTSSLPVDMARGQAEQLRDLYVRRQLIELAESTRAAAMAPNVAADSAAMVADVERQLYAIGSDKRRAGGFKPLDVPMAEMLAQAERAHQGGGRLLGITTGLQSVDVFLGGLQRSDLIILAGRPAMGKSALAANMAFAAAARAAQGDDQNGAAVGFFSLEMAAMQIMQRASAEHVGVSAQAIRDGRLTADQIDRLFAAQERMTKLPLQIDDAADLTIADIRQRARRLKRQHGLGMLVVDYLQLINGVGRADRVQQVSEISRGLKQLAKELNVPVVALSQLSRAVENRADQRPQLADLRESGSIEQDADIVMFVFRQEYYLERGDKKGTQAHIDSIGKAELIIAKHRGGATGTIELAFDGRFTRFRDRPERSGGNHVG